MNIFGYGGRPQGLWDKKTSNTFQDGSWADRDVAVAAARQELEAMNASSSIGISLVNTDTQNAAAVIQVQGAADQWGKLSEIVSGRPNSSGIAGGTVLGYDLETFGDTLHGARGQFGITEFGIGTTVFKEGGLFSQQGHSLAIGLSPEQATYVSGILNKYTTQGWASLDNLEQVTMRRMSMYADTGKKRNFRSVFSQITEEGAFKGMWQVKPGVQLAPDMSPERIARGIANLKDVYAQGATSETVLPMAMQYLHDAHANGGILTGANTGYDIETLRRSAPGAFGDYLATMRNDTVDLIYGVRAAADVRTISISTYQEMFHGTRGGGASVQALLSSLRLGETETHFSLSDINQQIQLLAARDFANGKTLGEDIAQFFKTNASGQTVMVDSGGKEIIKTYDSNSTLFLLNRGWLDKRHGADIALIDTGDGVVATQNYTITGEYWELDAAHTGRVEDGYRLSMVSTADGTIVSKRFETEGQALSFLRENADWYDRNDIGEDVIKNQVQYKYQDRGRRVFEKAFDPASVAVDGDGRPANGFAGLEELLQWNEQYGNKYSATPEGFHAFVADMNGSGGIKAGMLNKMQEYLGAQEKVADESVLLHKIVDQVNDQFRDESGKRVATNATNNMQKTIMARRAYEEAMATLSSHGMLQHSDAHQNLIMSDIFGIDVQLPDGRVSRINAHTVGTATRDVSRIFGQMTKQESQSVIDSLVARGVIDSTQGDRFKTLLQEVGIESGRDAAKKAALEKYLGTESSYQLYTDLGYILSNRANMPSNAGAFTLADKVAGTSGSFSARMQGYIHRRFATPDGAQSINEMLGNNSEIASQVSAGISRSVAGVPVITMHDGAGADSVFKKELGALTDSLGYGQDIITTTTDANGKKYYNNIVEEMFFIKHRDKNYGAAERNGVHSVIVRPDADGSAFVLLTNNDNYGRLMDELSLTQAKDIATYKSITGSGLAQYAAIYELPSVQRYTVGAHTTDAVANFMGTNEASLIALKQSENAEKFLITQLNVDKYGPKGQQKVYAHVNNGVYDYLTAWRMRGELALDKVTDGQFQDATRYLRQQQNKALEDLSSSASYRAFVVTDPSTGKQSIVRRPNYTPADYMYARRVRMTGGLHDLFTFALSNNEGDQRNNLDVLVDAYGEAFGVYRSKKQSTQAYRKKVAGSTYFKEFFNKNLFLGDMSDDAIVGDMYGIKDRNIFSLLQETIARDTSGLFDESVKTVLKDIQAMADEKSIYQVLSGTAMQHGDVSLGVAAGEYNVNAFLYDTMRPTYLQQNLGRMFDPTKEWDASVFKDDLLRTMAGSPEITVREYDARMLGKFADGYENQVRHVMTGFKQMNDHNLQRKYAFMQENAATLAGQVGLSEDAYERALQYVRTDMMSLHEGKWFIDPRIAEQQIVKVADAKKVKLLDVKRADAQRSGEVLQALVDQNALITANTIVGYDNTGRAMFAGDNLRTCLEVFNLEDIFDIQEGFDEKGNAKKLYSFKHGATGHTRFIPHTPDIADTKFMFNGSEKATGHAVNIDAFLSYMSGHGVANREQALDVLSKMFHQISDGATVIGNMNLEKHGNLMALDSPWRILTTEYVASGKGQLLADLLNRRLDNATDNVAYAGIGRFKFANGEIVSDTSHVGNPAAFLRNALQDILNDADGDAAINARVRDIIAYTKERGITYGALEFMNQNEHVSDGISLDKRIEQGIRQRAYALRNGENWDQQWADELSGFTGRRTKSRSQYDKLDQIFSFWDEHVGFNRIERQNKRINMEKSLHGIVESLVFYEDPNAFDVASRNILQVDFQDLIEAGVIPKNGAGVSDLEGSLFFTDGKPSEALRKLAGENVDFGTLHSSYSNSIYVNLGSYSILGKDGKTELHGFLMPIQNVITDADETMFQRQQGRTAKMLSDIQREIQHPGKRTTEQINARLSDIIRDYYRDSMKQLAVADKNSDYYKAIQRHFMGNSGGMLAEQEVAPMVYDDQSNARLMTLLDERDAITTRIANRAYGTDASLDDISRLDGISAEIKEINKATAERIRKGDVLEFTQLRGTALEGITKETINGQAVYGYVAATSRQAFEDHGLHFGKFGMDIMSDIELKGGLVPQEFVEKTALSYQQIIMDKINASDIGLTINNKQTMMQEINEWAKQFNIKDLNEAIAEKGPVSQVAAMFDAVAEDYMKQVGIVGELVRYPTFRSQFASRFVLRDNITSNQVVMFNPAASSITNVDFDGDLMYSIFKFNGSSGLLDRNAAMLQRQTYEAGLESAKELLAQLVEDGSAYKFTDPNHETMQMASVMKKMDRPLYETLRQAYADSHGFNVADMTAGQELAFHSSQEIRDEFLRMSYNTIFDLRSQKASIAPSLRKDNIGYVSTTNFNARTMIQDMIDMYGRTGDTKSYDQAVKILNAVTSPTSKGGGWFDLTEQLAIDTKHVWDAMTTAETARYSTGMHLLFGKYSMPRNGVPLEVNQRVAVERLVSSMYNSVFVDANKGLQNNRHEKILAIVDEIMHHKGDWMDYQFVGDAAAKRGIAALLALQELDFPNGMVNLRKIFTSSFNKGYDPAFGDNVSSMEEVSELMEMYRRATSTNAKIDPKYRNSQTYFRGLEEFIQQAISDRSLQTTSHISHAMPATLQGGEDLVVTLNHSRYTDSQAIAVFDVYRMDKASNRLVKVNAQDYSGMMPSAVGMKVQDGSLRFAARDNRALNQTLFGSKGFLTGTTQLRGPSAINNSANIAHDSFALVSQAKVVKGINSIVLDPSGTVASHASMLRNVQSMHGMSPEAQAKFGQAEYDTISQLFASPGVNASVVSKRTAELARTYEYARTTRQISTQIPVNDLLTSINEDIAAHPERYKDKSGSAAINTFDQIFERRLLDDHVFSSPERIEAIRQDMLLLGDFDLDAYNTVVQDLRNSIYDVKAEEEALAKKYTQFFASNPYGQTKTAQEAQATVSQTLGQFRSELHALNQQNIDAAQTKIYSMFKDRDQMKSFFGWNKGSVDGMQKVGFGMHIGQTFGSLTDTEAKRIMASAKGIIENKAMPDDVRFAAEQTADKLGNYMRDIGVSNTRSNMQFSKETSKLLENSMKKVDKLQEDAKIEVSAKQAADEMLKRSGIENASGKATRQTLTGHLLDKAKGAAQDAGIKGKHIGVFAAGLAALGIVNNLLHNQKTDSPLTPAHKPNGRGSPTVEGYYPDAPSASAPPSAGTGPKTVYHSNGLNFRVSANTARTHNARQQAAQMSSITGGSTNVNIQQDTSQVTNNWLENKFADLI